MDLHDLMYLIKDDSIKRIERNKCSLKLGGLKHRYWLIKLLQEDFALSQVSSQ